MSRKTKCVRGHDVTGDNARDGRGRCRECCREASRRRGKIATARTAIEREKKIRERDPIIADLFARRFRLGLSQVRLAAEMNTSARYLCEAETGAITPSAAFVDRYKNTLARIEGGAT